MARRCYEPVELLQPTVALPPERAANPRDELARASGRDVRVVRVGVAEVAADDGVLPCRHPVREQVTLAFEECCDAVVQRLLGQHPEQQRHGTLVQRAGRLAVRVTLDAAVYRIGCLTGDPRQFERAAVDPCAVVVSVGQVGGPIGDNAVEVLLSRRAAGERGQLPAGPDHPRRGWVPGGIVADRGKVGGLVVQRGQVAVQPLGAALHGMAVSILETRQQQAASEVDHLGAGAVHLARLLAEGHDPVSGHGNVHDHRRGRRAGEDRAVGEQQVGSAHG